MNKIIPLKSQIQGDAVADLQNGLRLLLDKGILPLNGAGGEALSVEFAEKTYGDATRQMVRLFQKQQGLRVTGKADGPTTKALNEALEEIGAFDLAETVPARSGLAPENVLRSDGRSSLISDVNGAATSALDETFESISAFEPAETAPGSPGVVSGSVSRGDGQPFSGGIVRAFHAGELDRAVRLGEDMIDAAGRYTIRYNPIPGVASVNLRVEVSDEAGKLLQTSAVVPQARSIEVVSLVIPGTDGEVFQVAGKVASRSRAGVDGLLVRMVDRGVGGDIQLAEVLTGAGGEYQVNFTDAESRRRGKARPDLQARVFAGETYLASSGVHYNATNRATINILLDDQAASALQSEHETLTSALSVHFNGALADLKETDDRQDITYLANKTGWDARAVALAALADQFSRRATSVDVPPVFFYALFRAGLPANEDTLYHTDAGTLTAAWNSAAEQGVISNALTSMIPQMVERFRTVSAQKLLTGPALAGVSSLKDMLSASRLNDAQQKQFAELYAVNRTDLPKFWNAVTSAFGQNVSNRLQVDGKLGFLTINNATLMQMLHTAVGGNGVSDPLQLAQLGYHSPNKWNTLLTPATPIPKEIPGDTAEARRANYAEYLAAQVRLSYPTASVAQMVKSGELPLTGAPQGASDQAHGFLTAHQGKFEIGVQPVQQYIAQNRLQVDDQTVQQVRRLQRVYQITPNDQAMKGLMKNGLDAAYHIARHEKDAFVETYQQDLGGPEVAAQTYDKSVQIYNAVLNITMSYLTAKSGIQIGAPALKAAGNGSENAAQSVVQPAPQLAISNTGDVIAYGTLENLFGSMDFCACDHCRSILSPAAYLVDLLQFIDLPSAGGIVPPKENPQKVLFDRRPDIQHLPLTCENTNTVMPYIDVVNETLEYFVANNVQQLSLTDYVGHDTNGVVSEDLLASPQNVLDAAYTTLRNEYFPSPLPFHQPLENLRRYFNQFEAPLPLVMERLRKNDNLERGTNPYGWRDILMEEIGLSRSEYEILTNSNSVPLRRMYGFPNGMDNSVMIATLSNAKQFTRRVGISYEELVDILKTRFVNPSSDLIPKLERLGVSFAILKAFKEGMPDADFDNLLPKGAGAPDPRAYGGAIKAWVKNQANFDRIMKLITLTNIPKDEEDEDEEVEFDFADFELRHAQPMVNKEDTSTRLSAVEFIRLLRFIRFWKKTGWTIEQTDTAICALYRTDLQPLAPGDIDTAAKLDAGFFNNLLPRLGIIARVMKALNLTPERDLLSLLACWSEIGTHGDGALYRKMFLNPTILKQDAVFDDNGYGEFLRKVDTTYSHQQPNLEQPILNAAPGISYSHLSNRLSYTGILDITTREALKNVTGVSLAFRSAVDALYTAGRLITHSEALRSAFNLTADEYDRIVTALEYDADTPLTLLNVSAIFRRGYLARKLHLGVREFLLLTSLTGLDPFAPPDLTNPAIVRLIELTQILKDRSIDPADALYLIWNQDLSGKSAPEPAQMMEFARTLRGDFAQIEEQFAVIDDAGGDIARARMALAYGQEVSDAFFALLDNTQTFDVVYTHPASALEAAITTADSRLTYDDFRHRLSYQGVLTAARRDALKSVPGVTAAFQGSINKLFARSEDFKGSFFGRYPELKPLYDTYIASQDPPTTKRSALAAAFRPALARQRKRQQALQRLSSTAGIDLISAQTLLDPPGAQFPLHAAGHVNQSALSDVIALETAGLAAEFFFDGQTDNHGLSMAAVANLDYASGSNNPLPVNPTPGGAVSGVWSGKIETPEAGFYNFIIETDAGTTDEILIGAQTGNEQIVALLPTATVFVELTVDGRALSLTRNGAIYRNATPLELKAGTLYDFELKVEKIKHTLSVKWENPIRAREVIPSRYLYPPAIFAPFFDVYTRFLKAISLAARLGLTTNEIVYLAIDSDYQILNDGWLNALPGPGDSDANDATALLKPLIGLLNYARIKAEISPADESLLTILRDPVAATAKAESLFFTRIRCASSSLNPVLANFGGNITGLKHFDQFRRVYDALSLIRKMGISASALIKATTNEPTGVVANDFKSALRARFDAADWRDLVRPINDEMRGLQRNALVAYILHQMRSNPSSEHIDTPDKLFEYFLMDVQMEPSMQTSRIRHALSSTQLFIERCLMNLEPRIPASRLDADRWEWMKRYRVWEANRKVFIYPENWLEPELRDDKSPFFKEIESELLQNDITEDAATAAVLNYLSKLDEVAKLEPCGIHHVPADVFPVTTEIDHVIARTAGANRKYYYRRREDGYWTPWEQVNLDIEDNPVMPYVWKGRLLLFWLRIIKQTPIDPNVLSPPPTIASHITELSLPQLKKATQEEANIYTKMRVQAVLCWSEYYNGKWQPAKTSDINRPTFLYEYPLAGEAAFDRAKYQLGFLEESNALRVIIMRGSGVRASSFLLYNTHSVPLPEEDAPLGNSYQSGPRRMITLYDYSLGIDYYPEDDDPSQYGHMVLLNALRQRVIANDPFSEAKDRWSLPFFYEDSRHTFFVTTKIEEKTISNHSGYGVTINPAPRQVVGIPPLILQRNPHLQPGPEFWDERGLIGSDPGVSDPTPMRRFVTEDAYIRQGIGTTGSVIYGDRQIMPSGAVLNTKTRK